MRGRRVVVTGVVVLLLAAGVVAADEVARATAEDRIAGSVGTALRSGQSTHVEIAQHRPLLLQLAGGRLDEVTVTADRATLDQGDVTDVRMRATGVTIRAPYTATDVTVTATVPASTVRARLAQKGLEADVAVAGGRLRASGTVLTVPWGVMLAPRAADGRLAVDVASADIGGVQVGADALPGSVRQALNDLDISVSGLPAGLAVTGAQVVGDGVQVTLTGSDVVLPAS